MPKRFNQLHVLRQTLNTHSLSKRPRKDKPPAPTLHQKTESPAPPPG